MAPSIQWNVALHPSAHVIEGGARRTYVIGERTATLWARTRGVRRALDALHGEGAALDMLGDLVLEHDDEQSLAILYHGLNILHGVGGLAYTPVGASTGLALVPIVEQFSFRTPGPPENSYVLSRFAHLHPVAGTLVLESPLGRARIEVTGAPGRDAILALTTPKSATGLSRSVANLDPPTASTLLTMLRQARVLSDVDESGDAVEDQDEALATWEFHDLFFHVASRAGSHDRPVGARLRFPDTIAPLPAIKPHGAGPRIALPSLTRRDDDALRPLDVLLDERRSVREYATQQPITVEDLGAFLRHVASIHDGIRLPSGPVPYEITRRGYPSGGATYPLELYPVVASCRGLASGVYHYCPLDHDLEVIAPSEAVAGHLIAGCGHRPEATPPQILLVITARFQRVTWKYQTVAYALILKEVGALMQTMYLVATAMCLAPCALGVGDSARMAAVIGREWYEESSVGEFLLGSLGP